ncbi:MAG: hypothetical protein R2865_10385 [Deinococcales bacterium]
MRGRLYEKILFTHQLGCNSLWLFTFSLADEVAPSRQEIRIIIVSHGAATDPFWRVVKNGIDQAQKDLGVRVEYHAPQSFDMSLMSKLIDLFAGARPDSMIVTIPDAEALGGLPFKERGHSCYFDEFGK